VSTRTTARHDELAQACVGEQAQGMRRTFRLIVIPLALALFAATGCGDDADEDASSETPGVRVVSVQEAADIQTDPPDRLVILDVRTPDEFAEGHLEGATMIDFYLDDFADRLADLDRDVPYLVYCRSGNRSEQAVGIMRDLGFDDVADVDGGITSWVDAGLPTVAP
jgi:rhodanese-related sulfurtransferase